MTTQVHIVNSSDSNPNQHARVTFKRRGYTDHAEVFNLSPGESKGFWIGGDANGVGDEITVVEVFAPKPVQEIAP
jgi:hypothetical protein